MLPNNIQLGVFVLGAVLLLLAIAGGNLEVFGAKISKDISDRMRVVAGLLGMLFLAVGLLDPRSTSRPVDSSPAVTLSTTTVAAPSPASTSTQLDSTLSSTVTTAGDPSTVISPVNRQQWELVVDPPVARNVVGADHQVYITLRDLNGFLIVGESVHLAIVEGPHAGVTSELKTNQEGQGVFSYTGNNAGTDVIHVWAGADRYEDAGRGTKAEITKNWF